MEQWFSLSGIKIIFQVSSSTICNKEFRSEGSCDMQI